MNREDSGLDRDLQDDIKELIMKQRRYIQKKRKDDARNVIYILMKPFIIKWIKSILRGWAKYETEENIIGLSWDSFYYCFNKYSNYDVPVPKFFYDFTRYFLLMHYAKKDRVFLSLEELRATLHLVPTRHNIAFEKLLTLYQFRDAIPSDDLIVWDDALLSMSNVDRYKNKSRNVGMSDFYYNRMKKTFISIIKTILE